jgi:hypothetical protein
MWRIPIRAVLLLALAFVACSSLLLADASSRSGDFLIRTPDGRTGTITLDRIHLHWEADKDAAKILGIKGGEWLPLESILLFDRGRGSCYACLENCDWKTFSEGDKGVIDIDPTGHLSPNELRKNSITAQWTCTSDM